MNQHTKGTLGREEHLEQTKAHRPEKKAERTEKKRTGHRRDVGAPRDIQLKCMRAWRLARARAFGGRIY